MRRKSSSTWRSSEAGAGSREKHDDREEDGEEGEHGEAQAVDHSRRELPLCAHRLRAALEAHALREYVQQLHRTPQVLRLHAHLAVRALLLLFLDRWRLRERFSCTHSSVADRYCSRLRIASGAQRRWRSRLHVWHDARVGPSALPRHVHWQLVDRSQSQVKAEAHFDSKSQLGRCLTRSRQTAAALSRCWTT